MGCSVLLVCLSDLIKRFSVNFCTLVWNSVFLNCGMCHPCPSKASALLFGYAGFSKQPHAVLYLEGKMRICFLFVALLTSWVKLRNLKYLYNNQPGDFKSSYSAEIPNHQCHQQCSAPLFKACLVMPASSDQCCRFSSLCQLLIPFLNILSPFGSHFIRTFNCPEGTWTYLISDSGSAILSRAPLTVPWQGAVPALGSWSGGELSPFCLGDVGSPGSAIAVPSLLITAQPGLMLRTALFFPFEGLLVR